MLKRSRVCASLCLLIIFYLYVEFRLRYHQRLHHAYTQMLFVRKIKFLFPSPSTLMGPHTNYTRTFINTLDDVCFHTHHNVQYIILLKHIMRYFYS